MQITFESYEEMMEFVDRIKNRSGESSQEAKGNAFTYGAETNAVPVQTQPAAQQPAPVQQIPVQQQPPVQQVPIQPATQAQPAVPTSERTYTIDELAAAAMPLVDKGLQAQLQGLLAQYGVEALPMLPPAQFGSFATALRGMGAQI